LIELQEILIGLSGLIGGAVISLVIFFITRRIGRKKNLYDERYWMKAHRAKAKSWDAMLVILIIAWGVVIMVEGVPSFGFFLIAIIYTLHCLTLAITTAIYAKKE
jgi:hypothetical protein